MTTKQTLIKEATALNINIPKKVTVAMLEKLIAEHNAPAPQAKSDNAAAIFSASETAAHAATNKKERQAKALARSQRENKVNNTLVTATIRVRQRITKTAIIEIALSVAATHIDHVSCQQVAAYIESEIADNVRYKHESNIATRVRNHCRAAMKKLCIVDSNDVIHFTESFKKVASDEKHIARVNALLAELKNS